MKRISSIDITRGIVMMIMALDHTRDLLHINSIAQSPTDLSTTSPILFFTRWITYLCAPIFVFLAGTSVYLMLQKSNGLAQHKKFLLKRGTWLIFLDLTVVNLGVFFDLGFHLVLFEVIAAIGFGFIILSLVLKIRPAILLAAGLLIIFGHGLYNLIPQTNNSMIAITLSPLFNLTPIPLHSNNLMLVAYPPIPWLGIMLVGYGAGKLFELPAERRRIIFIRTGLLALILFTIIRFSNLYGDPVIWSVQKSPVYTFLSFINVTKYAPSLLFTLITLGIMCLILGTIEKVRNRATSIAEVYGKVPLFYFIVHFYFIHILLIIVLLFQGFHWADMSFASGTFGRPQAQNSGIPLWAVYLVWMAVVAVLYRPCLWFARYKAKHNYGWLRYI